MLLLNLHTKLTILINYFVVVENLLMLLIFAYKPTRSLPIKVHFSLKNVIPCQ